jgi:hypothetical protein
VTSYYSSVTPPLPPVVFWNHEVTDLEASRSLSFKELSPRSLRIKDLARESTSGDVGGGWSS